MSGQMIFIRLDELRPNGVSILIGSNGSGKTQTLQRFHREQPTISLLLGPNMPRQALVRLVKMWLKKWTELVLDSEVRQLMGEMLISRGWSVTGEDSPWMGIKPASLSGGQLRLLWMILAVGVAVPVNGMVLIDEAEQSLHVGWQRRLVWELDRMAELRGIRVIMGTHAPAVIDDAWEWVFSMDKDTRSGAAG